MQKIYTETQVATAIHRSRRWLLDWLRAHPTDVHGKPFYGQLGKSRRFTGDDVVRLIDHILTLEEADKPMPKGDGTIYFVQCHGLIKIGMTRSWHARLRKMGTDIPGEAIILHTEPGTFADEKDTHRRFAHLRERGEWFRADSDILDYIHGRKSAFTP